MNFHLLENNILKEINLIDKVVNQIYLDDKMIDLLSYSPSTRRYFYLFLKYKFVNDITGITQSSEFENILNTYTSTLDYSNQSQAKLYVYNNGFGTYKFPSNVFDLSIVQSTPWYVDVPADSSPHIMYFPKSQNRNLPQGVNYVRRLYGLKNYNLTFSTLVTIELPMDEITNMLTSLKPTKGSQLFLINEDNIIISSTQKDLIFTSCKDSYLSSLPDIYSENSFTTNIVDNMSTKTLLSTTSIPNFNWKIVSLTPLNEINQDIYQIQQLIKLVVIIILLFSFIIALFLANRISNPIKKLISSMSSLDADNLYVEIKDYHFNDEFSYLINHYNATNKKIRDLIKMLTETEKLKKEAEFKALQAQINPHFLYNTLDAVNWLSLKYDAEDISTMVTSLSDFFRYSLSKGKTIIPLKNELIQTESYLTIQKIRFPNIIDYSIYCDDAIKECSIVKLTLQPLVENAIIHGIEPTDEPGFIGINCIKKEDTIIIEVQDNGIGADVDTLNYLLNNESIHNRSYGLKNVNQRIKNYYGESYGILFTENNPKGLTATITLPCITYEEMDKNVNNDNRR
ncbi:sensor histidine kinase [Vallitalea maricola]|uniref:sensor histidine kinase n=1 Tax=Vallitalea maricola TaxID=3074433 RepID=UPI0030DB7DB1